MFLGGLMPGLLMLVVLAFYSRRLIPKNHFVGRQFNFRELRQSYGRPSGSWASRLLRWGLCSADGSMPPVAAASLTAFYALMVEVVVHRELHPIRDVPRVMTECGLLVGSTLILGVAMSFTKDFLVFAMIPDMAIEWASTHVESKYVFLLALNVFCSLPDV